MNKIDKTTPQIVYDFIENFWLENGYSPNMQEVSDGVGLVISNVNYHVQNLRKAGWLLSTNRKSPRMMIPAWLPDLIRRAYYKEDL